MSEQIQDGDRVQRRHRSHREREVGRGFRDTGTVFATVDDVDDGGHYVGVNRAIVRWESGRLSTDRLDRPQKVG